MYAGLYYLSHKGPPSWRESIIRTENPKRSWHSFSILIDICPSTTAGRYGDWLTLTHKSSKMCVSSQTRHNYICCGSLKLATAENLQLKNQKLYESGFFHEKSLIKNLSASTDTTYSNIRKGRKCLFPRSAGFRKE